MPEYKRATLDCSGKTVLVNIYDAEMLGGCFGGVPCESMVQIVYKPAG